MGIGAKGDDFAAQFFVTADNFRAGICCSQSIFKTAGIDFQTDIFLYQIFQNRIQNFLILCIMVIPVLIRTVAYDVIQMAQRIEVTVSFQILQAAFKIFI